MKKRVFLMIALLCAVAQGVWAGSAVTDVSTADDLQNKVQTNNASIRLTADIVLSSYLDINGKTVTIDLNGHHLSRNLTANNSAGHVIWVHNGGKLTLKSTNIVDGSVSFGYIEGGMANNGGAIHIPAGNTVTAENIVFKNNSAADHAGAIWNNGTFTATNCSFENNSAKDVGAIYNSVTTEGAVTHYGSATLTDCTFTGNKGTAGAGALANALGETSMTIENCTITGNTAGSNGGGIWNGGTLRMKGKVTVTGNKRSGELASNVFLKSGTVITVNGSLTGSSIRVELEDGTGKFTSGYNTNHSTVEPSTIFTADYSNVLNVGLDDNEACLKGKDGVKSYYIERSWNDATKQVVSTVKAVSDGNHVHVVKMDDDTNTDTFTLGDNQSDNDEYYIVSGNVNFNTVYVAGSKVHLILCNNAKLSIYDGLILEDDNKLTIYSQTYSTNMGQLIVSNNNAKAAGIGSRNGSNVGELVVHGGHIEATGGRYGAGIGSCAIIQNTVPQCNKVTVYGGYVKATGGAQAAGIGGGAGYGSLGIGGGEFTLYGGTVEAIGGKYASGLGGGGSVTTSTSHADYKGNGGNGGTVNIYGGVLTATGGEKGAGIGSGNFGIPDNAPNRHGGIVNIYGGTVTATGGKSAAGIGGGYKCKGAKVTITGGTVIARAGEQGGTGNRAIGPGHSNEEYGELTIGNEMKVGAGNNGTVERTVGADERINACWYRSYAEISPCTHTGATYTVSGTNASGTHTMNCGYCTTAFEAEPHDFVNGECSVCHWNGTVHKVTIYLANAGEDGKYTTDGAYTSFTYDIVDGTSFTLPGAPQDLYDMDFAGWLVVTGEVPSFSTYKASADEILQLQAEGTPYTLNGNVSFVARYKDIAISLADNSDNSEKLFKHNGKTTNVTLDGRTIYGNSWNTLCLPFSLTAEQLEASQLKDADIRTLSTTSFQDGTLTLDFTAKDAVTSITAGQPYIVKPSGDIENPTFSNVTINYTCSTVEADFVSFIGIFSPYNIEESDNTMLYVGDGNNLYYPNAAMTIGSCRAFFQLNGITVVETSTNPTHGVRDLVLNFGDGSDQTGIVTVSKQSGNEGDKDGWYLLDGRKLSSKPNATGLYIHGNKKVYLK